MKKLLAIVLVLLMSCTAFVGCTVDIEKPSENGYIDGGDIAIKVGDEYVHYVELEFEKGSDILYLPKLYVRRRNANIYEEFGYRRDEIEGLKKLTFDIDGYVEPRYPEDNYIDETLTILKIVRIRIKRNNMNVPVENVELTGESYFDDRGTDFFVSIDPISTITFREPKLIATKIVRTNDEVVTGDDIYT